MHDVTMKATPSVPACQIRRGKKSQRICGTLSLNSTVSVGTVQVIIQTQLVPDNCSKYYNYWTKSRRFATAVPRITLRIVLQG